MRKDLRLLSGSLNVWLGLEELTSASTLSLIKLSLFEIRFNSLVDSIGDRKTFELDDLVGPFQPYVSMIL